MGLLCSCSSTDARKANEEREVLDQSSRGSINDHWGFEAAIKTEKQSRECFVLDSAATYWNSSNQKMSDRHAKFMKLNVEGVIRSKKFIYTVREYAAAIRIKRAWKRHYLRKLAKRRPLPELPETGGKAILDY